MRKEMLSCQRAFLRLRFPSQLEPSKPMRCDKSENTDMGWAISRQLELKGHLGRCNASRASAGRLVQPHAGSYLDTGQGETGHSTTKISVKIGIQFAGISIKVLQLPLDYQHHARLELDAEPRPQSRRTRRSGMTHLTGGPGRMHAYPKKSSSQSHLPPPC